MQKMIQLDCRSWTKCSSELTLTPHKNLRLLATLIFIHSFSYLLFLNTFASDLNQAVRAKTTGSYVALRERNSGAESSRELFKGSKDYSLQ